VRIEAYCDTTAVTLNASTRETTCVLGDPEPGKIAGRCPDCERNRDVGNPIDPGYGNKTQFETDYVGFGPFPLRFERAYNSLRGVLLSNSSGLGSNWTHTYERRIFASNLFSGTVTAVTISRPDGKQIAFNLSAGTYLPDPDMRQFRVVKTGTGWQVINPEDEVETYDTSGRLQSIANRAGLTQTLAYFTTGADAGRLQSVTDPFGRTLTFAYTSQRLSTVTIPGGGTFTYAYNVPSGSGLVQLTSATDPMSRVRTYHYELVPASLLLTGLTDELNVRFATWAYQTTGSPIGMATESKHAGNANRVTISYSGADATVTRYVTASSTMTNTYTFSNRFGVPGNNTITGANCPQCGPKETYYNGATGLVSAWVDFNLNHGNRGFDATRNLETARFEGNTNVGGFGTPTADSILTVRTWDANFRRETQIKGPLLTTTNVYDATGSTCGARGGLCSKSAQATDNFDGKQSVINNIGAPRVWTYTYNANGQVLTADGPRTDVSDVTTYTYYANNDSDVGKRGNVATVTNAMNQTTQITAYNIHGQPTSITDPNGLVTTLAYDGRQRLTSRQVGSETTTYDYNAAGLLTKVTLPDGSFLSYGYDAAHRLTSITDNVGNSITYTLDLAGNRTAEQVRDPASTLVQTRTRVYSSLNRLFQEIGAASQVTEYGYDAQGNVLTVKDPLNKTTTNGYDTRNRLRQVTDPAKGVAQYGINGQSMLTSVKDPRNLTTTYTVNGHGETTTQASPDTGTTVSTFDLAGNLATQTDAKSQVTAYAYDALNRVTLITFHDGSKHAFAYDAGTNGLGRLTSITETNPSNVTTATLAYAYDSHGRVLTEARTVNGVTYTLGYSYDGSGRLNGMTYPSGRSITYSLDAMGRINQITTATGGPTQVVVENILYYPFGNPKSWRYGNSQTYARTIDQDGRISAYTLGGSTVSVGFDAASRITGIGTNTYGYDTLDRLNSATVTGATYGYSYDAVGNRLTKTVGGNADTYTYSGTSNRIATLTPFGSSTKNFAFDATGSTTSDAVNTFTYDTRGRMLTSTNASSLVTTYQVNALGQRIRKTNSNEDTVYIYDTWGKLVAETDALGTLKREYVYLGDASVGVVQGGALAFVQPDHLNTPRHVYDASSQLRWRWDQTEPFGLNAPNDDPSSLGIYEVPLRFPGQYADKETNNKYNYFRDYDSNIGRYVESDPIGLQAGPNTYLYVQGSPLGLYDKTGLSWDGASQSARDLVAWIQGSLGNPNYGPTAPITKDLQQTPLMEEIRNQFQRNACKSGVYCGNYQYSALISTGSFVGQTVGSFCARIMPRGNFIQIDAWNTWGLESASRLPELPGGGSNRGNASIEQMLKGDAPLLQWPKSIFENRSSGAFANATTRYQWIEPNPCCK
jgi:RHS repeat-associated protein